MKRAKKKKIFYGFLFLFVFAGVSYFLFTNYFVRPTATNPPTADELKRMRKIEESSAKIAPNAVPGASVRPVGSLPKEPPPSEVSTTSTSTVATSSEEDFESE
jgi:hypothetical protein